MGEPMEIKKIREMGEDYIRVVDSVREENELMNMILYNHIPGMLRVTSWVENGCCCYNYCVSGKTNLKDYIMEKKFTFEQVKRILLNLCDVLERGKEYLIEENELLLVPEYIFLDEEKQVFLIYIPTPKKESSAVCKLTEVFEQFMKYMNHADKNLVFFIYEMYQFCQEEGFQFPDLRKHICAWGSHESMKRCENEFLREKENQTKEKVERKKAENPKEFKEIEEDSEQTKSEISEWVMPAAVIAASVMLIILSIKFAVYFAIPVVLLLCGYILYRWYEDEKSEEQEELEELMEETVLLQQSRGKTVCLAAVKTGKKLEINHYPYVIGKGIPGAEELFGHPGISRIHGRFEWERENLVYLDLNSTNGSFINNTRLAPYEPTIVHMQDEIRFAMEAFRVEDIYIDSSEKR